MQLRTVNKAIDAKYPGLELVKGDDYFYFTGAGMETCRESMVMVPRLNDLPLDRWVAEADAKMTEVAKNKAEASDWKPGTVIKLGWQR